jgi:hypothetical protein
VTSSNIDSSGVGTMAIRIGLLGNKGRNSYTLSSSTIEAADIITERNPRVSEFKGQ